MEKKKRLLDIIVTHYNESWDVCKPFFEMLSNQKGVDFDDFRIIAIQDGLYDLHYSYLISSNKKYNIIERAVVPHKGVSACRNRGLEIADAEWVCFCDCDDCYSSIFSLMMILHVLKDENAQNFDLMWNQFYIHDKDKLGKNEQFNKVFIHNKYYRLSFLKEHNLKFPEELYMSEDSAFNTIVYMEMDHRRIGTINSEFPLYSWCRREGSITKDFSKWINNTKGHFERNLYVLEEYRRRDYIDTDLMVVRTITDVYSMLSRPGIKGDISYVLGKAKDFYQANKAAFLSVSKDKVQQALEASDKDVGHSKEVLENRMPFEKWVKTYLE